MAEASGAQFLVPGDKELLSLKHHKSTRIVTPAAMIEILKAAECQHRDKREPKSSV
jgi:predicted nucleic acid-binding protein